MIASQRALLLTSMVFACTNARLFGDERANPPDETSIQGTICTSDPTAQKFPVKVLFLVDTSVADANYANQRGDAIERVIRSYAGPNYSFGIIRYSGPLRGTVCGFRHLTPEGFTKNLEEAIAQVRCADTANPGRDLFSALSLASHVVSADIATTSRGVRSRTKYMVAVLANGPPTGSLGASWCASQEPRIATARCEKAYFDAFCSDVEPPPASCERYQYVRLMKGLRSFATTEGAQELHVHAIYQRGPDASRNGVDDPAAVELLSELALFGGGTLHTFDGAGRCDPSAGEASGCLYSAIDFDSTESIFARRQLIVSNASALPTAEGLFIDSDRDGLADEHENALGTRSDARDTDGDTLSDRLEVILSASGLDPRRNDLTDTSTRATWPIECPRPGDVHPRAFAPEQDTDGDGLTDCEEVLLRSDPTVFDSDADGAPDLLEFRHGTNPLHPDVLLDDDADGLSNGDELRLHLAPRARDPSTDTAYRYSIVSESVRDVVAFTQPFRLRGVRILAVSPSSGEGRATIGYEPPPNPQEPLSPMNAAVLSWRDPQDPVAPGLRGGVELTADGVYVVSSATVEVVAALLPDEARQDDVRLKNTKRTCFDLSVNGIRLVDTGSDPETGVAGINFVEVFLAEFPLNNPRSLGVLRAASFAVSLDPLRRAPQPAIDLVDEDLLLFGD